MTNILLHGCNGRMGQAIAAIAGQKENCRIVCGVDIAVNESAGFPVYTSFDDIPDNAQIDVIIDFSHFSALPKLTAFAERRHIPAVIATTGFSAEDVEKIRLLAGKIAVFRSANMSIGICLIKNLVKKAAAFLGEDFDIEIVERHHNQKLDAPSGTALAIADAINEADNNKFEYIYDRHSRAAKRGKHEIGISAVRGGNIVGDHDVIFAGNNEVIEINHRALSRNIFAEGAIRAAIYLVGKPAGLYDMDKMVEEQ